MRDITRLCPLAARARAIRASVHVLLAWCCLVALSGVGSAQPRPQDLRDSGASSVLQSKPAQLTIPAPGTPDAKLQGQLEEAVKRPAIAASPAQIEVDIVADVTPGLLAQIKKLGGTVINQFPADRAIRAKVPLGSVRALAANPDVQFIQPAIQPLVNGTAGILEGDIAHKADTARTAYRVNGSGVKVCVISDSLHDQYKPNNDELAAARLSGDMPASLDILPGQAGTGTGEGLAMLEIVHKLAPGASLGFAAGQGSDAQMKQNIVDLAGAGHSCNIIVDDITYANESPFQDGIISQAVNTVTAAGVLYISSAANSGDLKNGTSGTWEGDFADGGTDAKFADLANAKVHQFGPGKKYVTLTAKTNSVGLYWSDVWKVPDNMYGLAVYDGDKRIGIGSTAVYPYQYLDFSNYSRTVAGSKVYGLIPGDKIYVIKLSKSAGNSGPADPRFLHLDTFRGQIDVGTDGSTHGHNAAQSALSVAAKKVTKNSSGQTQIFTGGTSVAVDPGSSDGPRRVFYYPDGSPYTFKPTGGPDVLASGGISLFKPDLTAAACVQTTFPPTTPPAAPAQLNPFCGTSAAAAHVAGIAALVLSHTPSLTAAQVRQILLSSALDIETAGWDVDSGYGILMADKALGFDSVVDSRFTPAPPVGLPNPNSIVFALQPQAGGKVLAAGDFGPYINIVRLNEDGSVDSTFNWQTAFPVLALALQNGKIVAAGRWTSLAWLDPIDGSRDTRPTLPTATDQGIRALAVQPNGKLLLGGDFTKIYYGPGNASSTGEGLARLNEDGSLDTTFNASQNFGVSTLAVQPGGKVLVGGYFNQIDGQWRSGLARLNEDGSLDTTFKGSVDASGQVSALAVQPDGKVLVGGHFRQVNGEARSGIARLDLDGSLDSHFVANANASVAAVALQPDGKVLIGGSFIAINGQPRSGIARLNEDGSLDSSFAADTSANLLSLPRAVYTLALQSDGKLLLGGAFSLVDGQLRGNIARLKAPPGP